MLLRSLIYMNGCGMPKADILHRMQNVKKGEELKNIFKCQTLGIGELSNKFR